MFSPVRWLLILLVILSLILTAAWRWTESIANHVASQQLSKFDMTLLELRVKPIGMGGIEIPSVSVRGPDMTLSVTGLKIQPLPEFEFQILIEQLRVELSESGSQSEEPKLGDLWQQLQSAVPMLPVRGVISELLICQPGNCETLVLSWHNDQSVIRLDASLPANGVQLQVDISDEIQGQGIFLVSNPDQVVGQKQRAISDWQIKPDSDLFLVSVNGYALPDLDLDLFQTPDLTGAIESLDVLVEAKLKQSASISEIQASLVANGIVKSRVDWRYELDGLQASSAGEHIVRFSYSDLQASVTLDSSPSVSIAYQDVLTGEFSLSGQNTCHIELVSLNSRCHLALGTLAVEGKEVVADISFTDVSVALVDELLDLKGRVLISAFDLQSGAEFVAGELSYTLLDQAVSISTDELRVWGQDTQIALHHGLDTGEGEYELVVDGQLKTLGDALLFVTKTDLSDVFGGLKGRSKVTSRGGWQQPDEGELLFRQQSELSLTSVAIDYDGYIVSGGSLQAELAGWPAVVGTFDLALASVAAGVEATNILATFHIQADANTGAATLEGKTLSLSTLGGQVESHQYRYDLTTNNGSAMLDIDKLQLPELLALQRQDFSCAGTLSGSVPVQFTAGNLSVKGAKIAAEAPGGFIQYQPDASVQALGQENQGVSVVLDAMRNFQYHTLSASVDYSEEGQMIARTSLRGANPDYQGGREVHLNLTVEENVKTLLESLRLGADLAEKVGAKSARGS